MTEAIEGINPAALPSGPGCVECEAAQGWWVHLRRCAACGHIGCCDSSPAQHAAKHFADTGHPYIQSFEPGEEWFWDFRSDEMFGEGPKLAPPTHHPRKQTVPGPRERVPRDWQNHTH